MSPDEPDTAMRLAMPPDVPTMSIYDMVGATHLEPAQMAIGYELFDHTADIGVRVRASSLAGLIAPATEGFYATIGEVIATADGNAYPLALPGDDPAFLLRDYLAELLHLFSTRQVRMTDVNVEEFTPRRLAVTGQARPIDPAASAFEREVKAVTYHELAIRSVTDGFEATYIVDI